jgi:ABC-2 type transport system permease protein
MKNIWIICRRELSSYFSSPIAWLLLTMYSIIFGWFFWNILASVIKQGFDMEMMGQSSPMNINEQIVRPLLGFNSFIGLFMVPLLSMRLFAEEKRNGTIELLATSPVRDSAIIVGKWLAATLLYCWIILFACINFVFLFRYGNPDWKPMLITLLGVFLQGAALLAIGTFISTLTKNQIIAGALTFGACLLLWVFSWVSSYDSSTWAQVFSYMSVITHFDNFDRGVLSTRDTIYYLSVIFLGLFFTARSMESLRWRS